MNKELNIWKSAKTVALVCAVLIAFVAKGTVYVPNAVKDNSKSTTLPLHVKGNKKGKSHKKEKGAQLSTVSFEATHSVFTVVFDDFSEFIRINVPYVPTVDYPVVTNSNIKVMATRYFRILFSKIQPINAP